MFLAALTSRPWTVPHSPQVHSRTLSGLDPSYTPHSLHTWLVGSNLPTLRNSRPYSLALYSSMLTNADHPASWTDFASRVRTSPLTARSSTVTAWFSRMTLVESLWWKSRRASATRACARVTRARAFSLRLLPRCLRDSPRNPHLQALFFCSVPVLVFVTKDWYPVFADRHLVRLEQMIRDVCVDFETELKEFNGERNHAYLYFAGSAGCAPLPVPRRPSSSRTGPLNRG